MRLKFAVKNSFFSVFAQIILIAIGFCSQRVVNYRMGEELVGMNSVISNIIALLSVSELGISTAIVYHLYKAMAEQNERRIAELMNLFRWAYYLFAGVISLFGLAVLPFIHLFLKVQRYSLRYIRVLFCLWMLRTVLSYLLSYKRSVLIADQKEYIASIATLCANAMNYLLIILIVSRWGNYLAAMACGIGVDACTNLWLIRYVNRKYPFVKTLSDLRPPVEMVRTVVKDLKNIFVSKVSEKILISTDSLIISAFVSVAMVGLYSNYTMISQSLINIVTALSLAIQPTIGHMFLDKDMGKDYKVFRQISFIFFLIASFASVSLLALMTPFVADVWLGKAFGLSHGIVFCTVFNFFLYTLGLPLEMMMGVTGLFQKERNLSILVAVVNLVISIGLAGPLGVMGVLIGTTASYLVRMGYRTYVLFRIYMKQKVLPIVWDTFIFILVTGLEAAAVLFLKKQFYTTGTAAQFLLLMAVCVAVPNGCNLLLFGKSRRAASILNTGRDLFSRSAGDQNAQITKEECILLGLVRESLTGECMEEHCTDIELGQVRQMAKKHAVFPLLYEPLRKREETPEWIAESVQSEGIEQAQKSYRLLFLSKFLVEELKKKGVRSVVLKGAATAVFYPCPELRKAGDVDLLLLDDVGQKQLTNWMEALGFTLSGEQHANHHLAFTGADGIEVELHRMFAEPTDLPEVNRSMEEALLTCREHVVEDHTWGISLPVLDLPYHGYQLLLHMLQHFLYAGFGLKLLADWVVLWNRNWTKEEKDTFRQLVEGGNLVRFTEVLTWICVAYLGLPKEQFAWELPQTGNERMFLREILDAEEFGTGGSSRMVVMQGGGLVGYVREFHHQMHLNYPKAGKVFLCWPVTWCLTLIRFLYNNRKLNRGSAREIMREASRRSNLAKQLGLFRRE